MVTDVKRNLSSITWGPPFSLNLTGIDPDIVYCVEVYNITCGVDDLVVGNCNVTEPRYVDNGLQQGHICRIIVTPRSNGRNAQNGTNSTKEGTIMHVHIPLLTNFSRKHAYMYASLETSIYKSLQLVVSVKVDLE